ncbi:T9SS type A sorting domain-containing protein [Nostoc sp. NIES-2111]
MYTSFMKFRFPSTMALAGILGIFLGVGLSAQAQNLPAADAPGSTAAPQQLSQNWTWAKKPASNSGNDNAYATVTDAAGNVYVAGSYTDYITAPGGTLQASHGGTDGYLIKYTYGGTKVWAKRMGGLGDDAIKGLAVDDQGRVYAVGYIDGAGDASPINLTGTSGNTNVFVACYNSSGNAIWAKSIGGTGTDIGTDIAVDGGYRVYVSGNYEADIDFGGGAVMAHSGSADAFLIALNASGAHRWHASVASTGRDNGAAVALGSGHVFFGGTLAGQATYQQQTVSPSGTTDGFLVRLDTADGSSGPLTLMGGAGRDAISGLDCFGDEAYLYASGQMSTGSLSFGSSTLSTTRAKAALVLRYSGTTPVWGRVIDAVSYGIAVTTGPDTSAYVAGLFVGQGTFGTNDFLTSAGQADLFTVNYDRSGAYGGVAYAGAAGADTVASVYADPFGAVYVAGNTTFTIDFGTIELVISGNGTECYLAKLNDPCMIAQPSFTTNSPVCVGQTLTLTGSNITPGAIVSITAPNGSVYASSTLQLTAAATQTAGVYTLKIASPVQSCIKYAYATVVVNPLPNTPTAAGTTLCGQGSAVLTAGNVPPGGFIEWYEGTNVVATGTSFTTPLLTATTTYIVRGVSAAGCRSNGLPVTVTISGNGTPPGINIQGSTDFCQGGSVTLNGTGGGPYIWSTGTRGTTITVRTSGSYTVSTALNGCTLTSAPVVVNVRPLPPSPTAIGDTNCGPGSLTLTAAGAAQGDLYNWYDVATGGSSVGSGNIYTTPAITFSHTYYVTLVRAGCSSSLRTLVPAVILPAATVALSIQGGTSLCPGDTVRLNASGTASSWQYYRNGTALPGATRRALTVSDSGTYSVIASLGTCSVTSGTVHISLNASPAAPQASPAERCGPGSLTLSASGAPANGSYTWYGSAIGGSTLTTGSSYTTPSLSASTTYYVGLNDPSIACPSPRVPVMATIKRQPVANLVSNGPNRFCSGDSIRLQASSDTVVTYQFNLSGAPIAGATQPTLVVRDSGLYTVTVTTSQSCAATSSGFRVDVTPRPTTPTINSQAQGNGILLTSSAAAGNQWFLNGNPVPGGTGQTLLINDPANNGTYTLQVTANGCTSAFSAGSVVTITGIADGLGSLKLTLAPNPTTDGRTQLKLTGARTGEAVQIRVLDALGRVVYTATPVAEATEMSHELNLSTLPKGLYTVRVSTTRRVLTQTVVRD